MPLSRHTKHHGISNGFNILFSTLQIAGAGNITANSPGCESISIYIGNNTRDAQYIIACNVLEPYWLASVHLYPSSFSHSCSFLISYSHIFHVCCHLCSHLHFPQPTLRLIVLIVMHHLLCIQHSPLQQLYKATKLPFDNLLFPSCNCTIS